MTNNTGMPELKRPCPLCGSLEAEFHRRLDFVVFDGSAISGDCSLVICKKCGFAFYDTPSTQEDFDRYYLENAYYYSTSATGSGGEKPEDVKRFEGLAVRLRPHLERSDATIFDIGCAKGGLLTVLARQGYSRLYGVDMVSQCVQHVRNALGMQAEIGSALNIPFPDVAADVLINSHVVEHIVDLKSLALNAWNKLNDSGILYVEVPDASRYGECNTAPYRDFYLEHVNHFDLEMLLYFFTSNGFSALSCGRYELSTGSHGCVPCIWAIFRKVKSSATPEISHNHGLGETLRGYLDRSTRHPLLDRLKSVAKDGSPLYVWGISQYAMLLFGMTDMKCANVKGLIDRDPYKRNKTLMGITISSPDILAHSAQGDIVFVAASGYEEEIIRASQDMGINGIFITTESY